jgi:hypothetical protein
MQRETDRAQKLYEKAQILYEQDGGVSGEAYCLWGLAEIALMEREMDTARAFYQKAQLLYQQSGGVSGEAYCL